MTGLPDWTKDRFGGLVLGIDAEGAEWPEVEALFAEFPRQAHRAIMRALDRGAHRLQTVAKRVISAELGVKQKDLVPDSEGRMHRYGGIRRLWAMPVAGGKLEAGVRISGGRIPIFRFGARPSIITSPRPQGGVRWHMGARGMSGAPDSFIAPGRRSKTGSVGDSGTSGHFGVFRRVGPKRMSLRGRNEQKIIELLGPSIPLAARKSERIRQALNTDVTPVIHERLRSQLNLLMQQRLNRGRTAAHPVPADVIEPYEAAE